MSEENKVALKKVLLVGVIFVPIVVVVITLGDLLVLKNEFTTGKLLFNFLWFSVIYAIFHKKLLKK